jgi:monoamine oxidase
MIDAVSTYVNGCELDQISILDMNAYEDTNINWRVRRGYGTLIEAYGAPCPIALNCNVMLIDHSGQRLRLETSLGTLSAEKVIVTVPTGLIADEAIRFSPALPAKVDAARGLPLGVDDKVVLALQDAEAFPKEGNLRGATMHVFLTSRYRLTLNNAASDSGCQAVNVFIMRPFAGVVAIGSLMAGQPKTKKMQNSLPKT